MSSLKRSQKFCPKCKEKNYIRQFFCKNCHYEFPKKDKSNIQNSSIEQFFFKMPISTENKKSKITKKENQIIDIIELDEEEEESVKIKNTYKKKNTKKCKSIKNVKNSNNNLSKSFNEIQNKKIKEFLELLAGKGEANNDFIEVISDKEKYIKIKYDSINNGENLIENCINSILFPSASVFPPCSFDIHSLEDINSFFISLFYRDEKQINILNNIIIYKKNKLKGLIKVYQNKNSEEKEEDLKLLYNQNINTNILECDDKNILYILSFKNILQCNLMEINLDNSTSKILEIFKISSKNLITKMDFNVIYDKYQIRVLLSDSENNIFYYLYDLPNKEDNNNFYENKNKNIKLIGIYDYLFLYKITDIKFLNVRNFPETQNDIFYYMASSRDGLLYILNNLGNIIFQHKTNQTWITQCTYDSLHNILLFLTNFDDKVVGVKFNVAKDPIIKRIPKTNNPYYCQMTPFMDKFLYLDDKSNIYCLSTFIIEDMFKSSKFKKKNEYKPQFLFSLLNDVAKPSFLNKFRILGNNKNIICNQNEKILLALIYNKEIRFVLL